MRKSGSRILALLLAIALCCMNLPVNVYASNAQMKIMADSVNAQPGGEVKVKVMVEDNPGIASMKLNIGFDDVLTLTAVEYNQTAWGGMFQNPQNYKNPVTLNWFDGTKNFVEPDAVFATLTFRVADNAEENEKADITVTYDPNDVYNIEENNVDAQVVNGTVTICSLVHGDINGDRLRNNKDVTRLFQYLANWKVTVVEKALDTNNDKSVNNKDLTRLFQYLANWDVELWCDGVLLTNEDVCKHDLTKIPYKAPTCEEAGNLEYYYCSLCKKNFSNASAVQELVDVTLPKKGHDIVIDEAVAPTPTKEGLTEGSHCSVCGTVFVEQKLVPKLEESTVTVMYHYEGLEQDSYLTKYVINNDIAQFNQNDEEYKTETKGYTLKPLLNNAVPGYRFLSWVDGYGNTVTSIEKGDEGLLELYASWQIIPYWVTFKSPDVPAANIPKYDYSNASIPTDSVHYTVASGLNLNNHNPSWYGYTFVGWSDSNGFLTSEIKPGTTGNITVQANWTSDRNKATSYKTYEKPIIIEDAENGQYLFVYNIGKIDKVPLNVLDTGFHNMDTYTFSEEVKITDSVNEGLVNEINEMISNATTKSSGWTLSSEWSDLYEKTEETGTLSEKSDERTTKEGTVVGGKYFVSNSESGSTHVSTESGGASASSSKVTTENSFGINRSYDTSTEKYCDAQLGIKTHLGGSNTTEVNAGVEFPIKIFDVSAGVKNTTTIEGSIDGEYGIQNGRKDNTAYHVDGSYSGYVGTVKTNDASEYYNSTLNNSSSWNSETGYEKSNIISNEESVTKAIKEQLSNTTKHSISKALSGGTTEAKTEEDTTTTSEEYNTTFTYGKTTSETTTKKITQEFSVPGYYRYITAGTVHVYGVVGYDVATASYYTYCFNVLDDTTYQAWDYSKDNGAFNDCENGVVTFDIPYEVNEYIAGMVGRTNGLEISDDGKVTNFVPEDDFDGTVIIPHYVSKDDLDGRNRSAVKVTSFNENVFANVKEDIKTVVLPMYITKIPDNAFKDCVNLKTVIAYGVTEIGENAFAGCKNLEKFYVDNAIVSLGDNAFKDVPEVAITAYDSNVAQAAIRCGAKNISLNIAYIKDSFDNQIVDVPATASYFALIGNGGVYNNVTIKSEAGETMINKMTLANNTGIPIDIGSAKVTFARIAVENAPGFAVVLRDDHVLLNLVGDVKLTSKGKNAFISKNVTLGKADSSTTSKLILDGNCFVCGEITNTSMYEFEDGEVIYLTEDEYTSMLTSCILTFNSNGGEVTTTEKIIYPGQKYGELPIPERNGYVFTGWYKDSGCYEPWDLEKDTVQTDTVLYAGWEKTE